jgi:transcriptional regulator with XRE-family HTH domain
MAERPLSELLRELREERGHSLRAAARDLGVDPSYLSRVERGAKPASSAVLQRAADYYDVPLSELAKSEETLPGDVLAILHKHPEVIHELRDRYGFH